MAVPKQRLVPEGLHYTILTMFHSRSHIWRRISVLRPKTCCLWCISLSAITGSGPRRRPHSHHLRLSLEREGYRCPHLAVSLTQRVEIAEFPHRQTRLSYRTGLEMRPLVWRTITGTGC